MGAVNVSAAKNDTRPAVTLRGTKHGLEVIVDAHASTDDIVQTLSARLDQSPAFFANADVTFRLIGHALPLGALAKIESLTSGYGMRIVGIRPAVEKEPSAPVVTPQPAVNTNSSATTSGVVPIAPVVSAAVTAAVTESLDQARWITGPVRCGAVVDAPGHVVVFGDVNHGAEIRAGGNIVVLGALRGLAHAGRSGGNGCIIATKFEVQQLRIGSLIARAAEPGASARGMEIAYAHNGQIVVENFVGRIPNVHAARR